MSGSISVTVEVEYMSFQYIIDTIYYTDFSIILYTRCSHDIEFHYSPLKCNIHFNISASQFALCQCQYFACCLQQKSNWTTTEKQVNHPKLQQKEDLKRGDKKAEIIIIWRSLSGNTSRFVCCSTLSCATLCKEITYHKITNRPEKSSWFRNRRKMLK